MAGRRSGWSEFLRAQEQERARIEREKRRIDAAVQRERQEEERAKRTAERRVQADARERDRLAHETAAAEAEERTEEVNAKVRRLETILDGANPNPFSFEGLRRVARIPRFDLARFGPPAQSPDCQEFAPEGPPRGLAAKFGGRARYEHALEEARRLYQEALDTAQLAEASRQARIRQAREEHQRRADAIRAEISRHNQAVDLFEAAFWAGDPGAVEDVVGQVLDRSQYPAGFPVRRRLAYRPEPRELWIEFQLPGREIVPPERGYRYVKTRNPHTGVGARPATELPGPSGPR